MHTHGIFLTNLDLQINLNPGFIEESLISDLVSTNVLIIVSINILPDIA